MTKGKKGQTHQRKQQNAREGLPVGNGSLDKHWNKLNEAVGSTTHRLISEAQLAEAMLDAVRDYRDTPQPAVQAEVPMDAAPPVSDRVAKLLAEVPVTGTAMALAQSLKVMAAVEEDQGRHGHTVIASRAERFVRLMAMNVTRFLSQPDCRLNHPSVEGDLCAAMVEVSDSGQVSVHCTDVDGSGWMTFPLDELVPAGPVNDIVRVMVTEMGKGLVHDAIGNLIASGALPGFDTFQSEALQEYPSGGEAYTTQDAEDRALEIHHLQAHAEYVMDGSSPAAVPSNEAMYVRDPERPTRMPTAYPVGFEPPEGDDGFGQNGS